MSTSIDIKKRITIKEEGSPITTDVNSINITGDGATTSAIGNDVTINIPGAYGVTTFYMNETVTQAPYKEFSSTPTAVAEQTIVTNVAPATTVTIQSFQTPVGVPNTTNIPGGRWAFYVHFSGTLGDSWTIFAEVYLRDLGAVETLVLTTDAILTTTLSGTATMILTDGIFPTSTVLTTDRIVVKVKATNNDPVNNKTITFHTEGSTNYSIGTTTLNQVIAAGSVTSVTGVAPVQSSGGTTPAISMPQATALVDGYLSAADWTNFSYNRQIQDEGVNVTQRTTVDFQGAGVSVADAGGKTVVTIPGSTTGRFGIADSAGAYTYYTTLTLAMAAAVAGQTIEFFTDYNETGAVTITLKNGVNINMNGHTYTHSHSAAPVTAFTGTSVKLAFTNGKIVIDSGAVSSTGLQLSGSTTSLDCSGLFIQVISSGGTGRPLISTGGTVRYLRAESIDELCASAVRTTLFNCFFTATTAGDGLSLGLTTLGNIGTAYDCYVKTRDGYAISANVNSSIINCNAESTNGVGVALRGAVLSGGRISSSASYGLIMDTEYSVGVHSSCTADNVYVSSGSTAVLMIAISTANNYLRGCTVSAVGNAIEIGSSSLTLNNYVLNNSVVSGAAFNCIYASVANIRCVYANNTFHQSTTPVSTNIIQDVVNTQDNQGNILV